MTKYLVNRILRSLFSVMIVVAIVMLLIYSCLDRNLIFANDSSFSHMKHNAKEVYMMQQWERYGYVDYVPYADYLRTLVEDGEIDQATYDVVVKFGNKASNDSEEVAEYVQKFTEYYESQGYEVVRKDEVMKGNTKKYQDGGNHVCMLTRTNHC